MPTPAVTEGNTALLLWLREQADLRLRLAESRVGAVRASCADRDDVAGIQLLTQTLTLMIAQARRRIDELLHRAAQRPDRAELPLSSARSALQIIDFVVREALEALVLPPKRDMASMVHPYIRLARAVTGQDGTELIFGTKESFEYQVWPNLFREIEQHVKELAPGLETTVTDLPKLAQIEYPAQADGETFLHAVVAHEVAHLALERPSEEPDEADTQRQLLFDRALASSPLGQLPPTDPRVRRMHHWFVELACDTLALHLIGPAFLLGLTEYLLPTMDSNYDDEALREREAQTEDEDEEVHPPPAWRIHRLRMAALHYFAVDPNKKMFGRASLTAARAQLDRYHRLVPDDEFGVAGGDSPASQERRFLTAALQPIVDDPAAWVTQARYTRGTFQRDLPLIWNKMDQGIAPCERIRGRRGKRWAHAETDLPRAEDDIEEIPASSDWSEPIDWRSILNSGFFYYLHHAANLREGATATEQRRASRAYNSSLVRGSIELSEMHRQMLELRDEFDWLNEPMGPVT